MHTYIVASGTRQIYPATVASSVLLCFPSSGHSVVSSAFNTLLPYRRVCFSALSPIVASSVLETFLSLLRLAFFMLFVPTVASSAICTPTLAVMCALALSHGHI